MAPYPAPSNFFYLVLPVMFCAGVLCLAVGATAYTYALFVLDGLIVVAAMLQIFWMTVLPDLLQARGEWFDVAVLLAHPIADLVALMYAVVVFGRGRNGNRTVVVLVTLALAAFSLAACVHTYLTWRHGAFGPGIAGVWRVVGLVLMIWAGVAAAENRSAHLPQVRPHSRFAPWAPYVPLIIIGVIGVIRYSEDPEHLRALTFGIFLMLAVLIRQLVVIRQNRTLMSAVEAMVMHDQLTGLVNRGLFLEALTHSVSRRQTTVVLSMDLDDFRVVNEGLGHPAGDLLLTRVAERIRGVARRGDIVARLGADEFAVLIEGDVDEAMAVAQRVTAAFDQPFDVDGHELKVRVSAGLAVASSDGLEMSAEDLLGQADAAMAAAKRARTPGVRIFSAELQHTETPAEEIQPPEDVAASFQLLAELRSSIDNAELVLMYQPKIDLRDDSIAGLEALLRWPHPVRGMLGPDEFLPLVRERGLMRAVTDLVLAQALDQVALWRDRGVSVPVAVNLFAPSLSDLTLPDRIVRALGDRVLAGPMLTVEVTEDLLLDEVDRSRSVIEALRANGVRVALDDFGSGYSTLSNLRDLPIDEIKLDRDFVTAVSTDARSGAIVKSVIALAHELGLTTVVEGIENAETLALLRVYGCRYAQGYYYSEPLTAAATFELLRSRRRAPDAAISN
ncbi:putative bifunctional diguanylate cyclase/phosphodiesterase [Mycobacterium sp. C31M]